MKIFLRALALDKCRGFSTAAEGRESIFPRLHNPARTLALMHACEGLFSVCIRELSFTYFRCLVDSASPPTPPERLTAAWWLYPCPGPRHSFQTPPSIYHPRLSNTPSYQCRCIILFWWILPSKSILSLDQT